MKNLLRNSASVIGIILLATCFTACSNDTETVGNTAKLDIQLNDGEKWIANAETSEGINHLSELMDELNERTDASIDEYNEFGTRLSEVMHQLVDQCTMDGEAHEQLHVYLMPIFKYIKIINGDNLENCKHGAKHLTNHLEKYNTYFALEA